MPMPYEALEVPWKPTVLVDPEAVTTIYWYEIPTLAQTRAPTTLPLNKTLAETLERMPAAIGQPQLKDKM